MVADGQDDHAFFCDGEKDAKLAATFPKENLPDVAGKLFALGCGTVSVRVFGQRFHLADQVFAPTNR